MFYMYALHQQTKAGKGSTEKMAALGRPETTEVQIEPQIIEMTSLLAFRKLR